MTITSQISETPSNETLQDGDTLSRDDVLRLAELIDFNSPMSIHGFGSEVAKNTAEYTDEVLRNVRTSELAETGDQLNQIIAAAKQFDFDSLDNDTARQPFLGGLFRRFSLSKDRALARFETIKAQVDKLVEQVESTARTLHRRSDQYEAMYEGIRREHALLGSHVEAIEIRLRDLDREIGAMDVPDGDIEAGEQIAVLESSRQLLTKRADDMRVLQHSALQTLPMVRIIQASCLALVDKFQTIRTLTLPTWKRSFMLALTLDEQKRSAELATSIDDTTDAMLRRNAELLHQNSVQTARANQRLVIDVDTLRDVHNKILLTFADVKSEHESGAQQRAQAIKELDRLRKEMAAEAKAIVIEDA